MHFVRYFNFDPNYSGSSTDGMIYRFDGKSARPGEIWWNAEDDCPMPEGFYWIAGMPGCLFDSDPVGPFPSADAAIENAQEPYFLNG